MNQQNMINENYRKQWNGLNVQLLRRSSLKHAVHSIRPMLHPCVPLVLASSRQVSFAWVQYEARLWHGPYVFVPLANLLRWLLCRVLHSNTFRHSVKYPTILFSVRVNPSLASDHVEAHVRERWKSAAEASDPNQASVHTELIAPIVLWPQVCICSPNCYVQSMLDRVL